jgi:hypothetical protein
MLHQQKSGKPGMGIVVITLAPGPGLLLKIPAVVVKPQICYKIISLIAKRISFGRKNFQCMLYVCR